LIIDYGPYGNKIVSGDEGGNIKVWAAFSGRLISNFSTYSGKISSIKFTPDGKYILSDGKHSIKKLVQKDWF
jgi:WD40 repeat protein